MLKLCNKRIIVEPRESARVDVNVAIHVRHHGGVDSYYYHNAKTTDYLNLLRDHAGQQAAHAKILYMAWGTDTSAPSAAQHALGNERGRKQVTRTAVGTPGVVTITTIISSTEANGEILGEFALYAGPAAADAKDSGVMAARVVWDPPHTKNYLESIQVDWQITFN